MPNQITKYEPLFGAYQRSRFAQGAQKARDTFFGGEGSWKNKVAPILHGAGFPLAIGLPTGALGYYAAGLEDPDMSTGDKLMAGLATAAVPTMTAVPMGVDAGMASRRMRKYVEDLGSKHRHTRGTLFDFAQRAAPHATDPGLAEAMKRYSSKHPLDRNIVETIRHTDDERRVGAMFTGAARRAKPTKATGPASDYLDALRKEFPDLKDRQLAGKLHPDQRGATEAPAEVLDAAYRELASNRSSANAVSTDPIVAAAHAAQEAQNAKSRDFLNSFKFTPPKDLR